MNTALWLLVCASACTAVSTLVPPAASRMRRIDMVELRRRRRLVHVLHANSQLAPQMPHHPAGPGDAQDHPHAKR
ncbi:hypothetical protein [Streptomyces sp. SP18CS02]|uniref:hypothetical protein n=1 Tax=Streptomyces sp. SP18CS02 TaxID=3002531 RepID=UPI002E77BAAF|nr:hypothetical protein [Streptomyces sp. SP18CS02]MEE1754762.1 hypothetical protein [Streptomyces sp. SP18CS02]